MPRATGSSIGGVSAVNPQAKGSYQDYIDASYDASRLRLDPIQRQQTQAFDQGMVNRGIPVGGEAYSNARQQLDWNQSDADKQAAFDAMQFGLFAQNQDFSQDATRSGLANALLAQKWSTDLGYYNTDQNVGLAYAGLDERGRQFDQGLGQRGYEFDATLGNKQYEFDRGLDYKYYDLDNKYDYAWDRASQDDFRFGANQDRQDYYDERDAARYDDAFLMQLLGMGGQPGVYGQDPTNAFNNQISERGANRRSNMAFLSKLFSGD